MAPDDQRASPEALLALAEREGRGRLKIFLGAFPGAGKTYAMLQAARAARADGLDVAAGVIETHGRAETQALLEGLEVLPRAAIPYRGRMVAEFDLDAALERRPALLLVDEYAHTNAPGSRHPKRWQDVQELLAAGIDVWTTLNVQHLESLNDVIQRITKVRVRETIPDSVFEKADDVVLVDVTPDELLKRLSEGKVYVQDTATRAVEHFFRTSNLLALRELALRRAAERIDADLVERMQGSAIEGPWAAGERILALVGPDASSHTVVRSAKRLADLIGAPWFAITVEQPERSVDPKARRRVAQALRLAESLGAQTQVLVGRDIVGEALRFARFENVTQVVIGRSRRGALAHALGRALPEQVMRHADDIAVHVVTAPREARGPRGWRAVAGRLVPEGAERASAYAWSALGVLVALVVGLGMTAFVAVPNVSMVFILAVVLSAVAFGFRPAILASVLSFLGYNFFFIDPLYTFTIAQPHELLALVIFLAMGVVTSAVAARARQQAVAAGSRVKATRRLYEFARKMSALPTTQAVADGAVAEIHTILQRPVVLLLPEDGEVALAAAWPPEDALEVAALSAARWAFEKNEPAGADTGTLPNVPWYFVPLRGGAGPIGVLGVAEPADGAPIEDEARALLDTLAEQTSAALERARLAREMAAVKTAAETERVRNILLASISHDFRTPLASILGAATSLRDLGPKLPEDARADLLAQVREEAEHLDAMVRNLLAMTRVEAGALEINATWIDVAELIDRVVVAAKRRGARQSFAVAVEPGLPLARGDQSLLDQTLTNIVSNAIRYGGGDARITISARRDRKTLSIIIADDGPGIAPDVLPHVFEKFVRARNGHADGGEGSGLGLAIAKGVVEAHGGTITAVSPVAHGRGTAFTIHLPLTEEEPEA
ncbi:sensor histidine kinase [Salinarimonas ramus]|uniref:histidine kinase n=1 Tax=Salinarimonas ramus TaxID=690164 RepID=A0A917QD89_9HYPH|nr:sensor histidine kinase KdpD [Salinarimonas ramus]GGK44991.1 histidine kinase [Salinarimonas ramus]